MLVYAVNALSCLLLIGQAKCSQIHNDGIGKDNGLGSKYVWASSLDSGLKLASNHQKPVMLVIHKSWCSACKNLKPKFADSEEILSLSKHFVMVNVIDDEEPKEGKFAPDGTYIPRILFLSISGDVLTNIYNESGNNEYRFFYSKTSQIAHSMKKVLETYKPENLKEL